MTLEISDFDNVICMIANRTSIKVYQVNYVRETDEPEYRPIGSLSQKARLRLEQKYLMRFTHFNKYRLLCMHDEERGFLWQSLPPDTMQT